MASCKSTEQMTKSDGIDFRQESLTTAEMANWAQKNHQKCAELIQGKTTGYIIDSDMISTHPCLVYLLLNSATIVSKEDKQEWFDLYEKMNEDQIYSLYDILYRERHKLLSIKNKWDEAALLNQKAYDFAFAKKYDKALETINKAINKYPKEANLYDSKGEILLMMGDSDGALEMWKKVLKIDPNFLSTHSTSVLYKELKRMNLIR